MGVVHPGKKAHQVAGSEGARPFKVLSLACEDKAFKFAANGAEAKVVHVIPVTSLAGNSEGKVTKTIGL